MINKTKMILWTIIIIIGFCPVLAANDILISNIFFDTFIIDALSDISIQAGIPIIADSTVTGFVTLELNEVPLEKALEMILISNGYDFSYRGDYYLVGIADIRNPNFRLLTQTEHIRLQYISPQDAKNLLPAYFEPYLRFINNSNILTISAPPHLIAECKEYLAQIDQRPQQVKVQVVVTEISSLAIKELGTNLLQFNTKAGETFNEDWKAFFEISLGTFKLATDFFGEIMANLKIMEERKEAKIVADPWVLVNDRSTVNLFVGERQVVLLRPNELAGRIERIDIGVDIMLTPIIRGNDEIEIEITPLISHLLEDTVEKMITHRSELSTTVILKENQPLFITGITLQEEKERTQRVPLLGRIPLLRWLFGVQTEEEGSREMFIILTASII